MIAIAPIVWRAAPYLLLAATVAYGVHRIRADATAAAEQTAALANETARADGLRLAVDTLRGHYERAAAASTRHRNTVNALRATHDADQAALARQSDACLDAALPADLRDRLRGDTSPVDPGADAPADASGTATDAGGGLRPD